MQFYKKIHDITPIGFEQRGSFHIAVDDKRLEKFHKMVDANSWPSSALEIIEHDKASQYLPNSLAKEGLWMPLSAVISPCIAVNALVELGQTMGGKLCLNSAVQDLKEDDGSYHLFVNQEQHKFDKVVICNALQAKEYQFLKDITLKPVRGQVTVVNPDKKFSDFKTNLCFGGYMSRLSGKEYILGATYDRGDDQSDHRPSDDQSNLDYFNRYFEGRSKHLTVNRGRASVRTSSDDYSPYIGNLKNDSRLFVSLAHRSHGLTSSPLSAKIILNLIMSDKAYLYNNVFANIDANRVF